MKKSTNKYNMYYDHSFLTNLLLYNQTFKLRYQILIFRLYPSKHNYQVSLFKGVFIHKVPVKYTKLRKLNMDLITNYIL